MLFACVLLLSSGGILVGLAARWPNAAIETAAGLLIMGGLVLLGYELHKIISV